MIKPFLLYLFCSFLASLELPLSPFVNLQKENVLNIVNVGFSNGRQSVIQAADGSSALKVVYPKGSYKPSSNPIGGIGIYASPPSIFPVEEATLTYQLYFDAKFQPVLGGKLPGFYIATGTNKGDLDGGSGGIHTDVASVRVMWRQNMDAEAYVYLPVDAVQDPSYGQIPGLVRNSEYGDSLWRGYLKFNQPGQWNQVKIYARMNTVGKSDGILEVTINDVTKTFNKLVWRTSAEYKLCFVVFETFFGGNDPTWETPIDTYASFKNVNVNQGRS